MNLRLQYQTHRNAFIFLAAGLALLAGFLCSIFLFKPTQAANHRVITIYDQGKSTTVTTTATTVADVLKRANVQLDKLDVVEPVPATELTAPSYAVNVYRARPVTIVDGANQRAIMSPYQSARSVVIQAGYTLYPEDIVRVSRPGDMLTSIGEQLTIEHATPVNLVLYGTATLMHTQSKTVAAFIKEKGITLGPQDQLATDASAPIVANMTVEVWRNGVQTVNQEEPVPFDTQKIQNANQPVGYKQVQTPGVNGKKLVTYQVEMKNGAVISKTVIQSVVTIVPSKQVEVVGTKPVFTGDFAAALSKLGACESGGNYANKHNPLYRGAFQYDYSTWANYQGYYDPADAPAAVQDQKAWETYQRRGWQPWPVCGAARLPDSYR